MTHFAFLRNVMIGRKGLTQTVLLDTFRKCGAANAASFLSTGNITFDLGGTSSPVFLVCVAAALEEALGLREPIYLRSLDELMGMRSRSPFAQAPGDDVYERCVTFLPQASVCLPAPPLVSARRDVEIFAVSGCEAYSITHLIGGKTGSPGALIEELAGVKVTTRNWNTIERLLSRYA